MKKILLLTLMLCLFALLLFVPAGLAEGPALTVHLGESYPAGAPVTASWTITGGMAPYEIYHASCTIFEGENYVGSLEAEVAGSTATITPRFGDRGEFLIGITDANQVSTYVEQSFAITGSPQPMKVQIDLPESVQVGSPITASWTVNDGVGTYSLDSVHCSLYQADEHLNNIYPEPGEGQVSFIPPNGSRGILCLTLTDDLGRTRYIEKTFAVTGSPAPLSCEVSLSSDSVAAGQAIKASWTITGGKSPYTVACRWRITESNDDNEWFAEDETGGQASFVPKIGVIGEFCIDITDAYGASGTFYSKTFSITGSPEPLSCTVTLDKDTVAAGQAIKASWTITGGKAPHTVACSWFITESNGSTHWQREDESGGEASLSPSVGVEGYFSIQVTDANGTSQRVDSTAFVITGAPQPLELSIALDRTSAQAGQPITLTATVTGGVQPYQITYSWDVFETYLGEQVRAFRKEIETAETTSAMTFSVGENGNVRVEVTDGNQSTVSDTKEFTIVGGGLISTRIPEITAQCKSAASGSYARAKWLHDYLRKNAKYDYTYTHYYPHGVLLLGTGVCNSYATAYQLLLNAVGISNKVIVGEGNNGSWGAHGWNLVSIGGYWYHVDVTWDDGWGYKYFLKSDKSMSADHRWDVSKYPACPYDWGKAPAVAALPGDADLSGVIDLQDLVVLIDYLVAGKAPASMDNANADGNGDVDIQDLVWIIDKIVGG
ncbi:MAG: transglutaminase domain-containing protein [Christensenellales bacterium]